MGTERKSVMLREIDNTESNGTASIHRTVVEGTRLLKEAGESLLDQLKTQCAEVKQELQRIRQQVSSHKFRYLKNYMACAK